MTEERFKELTITMVLEHFRLNGIEVCNAVYEGYGSAGTLSVFVDCDDVIDVANLHMFERIPSFVCCHIYQSRDYIRIRVAFDKAELKSYLVANWELESSIK